MALAEDPLATEVDEPDLREQILDAAHGCILRYGVPKTTIDDVVKAARTSRATLYKYVPGGRDELIVEVLIREARRNIDVVFEAIHGEHELENQLAVGILAAAERIDSDDHLRFLYSPDIVHPHTGLAGAAVAMINGTVEVIAPFLARGRASGLVREDVTDIEAAEWTVRTILSLITFSGPSGRTRDELLDFIRRYAVRPMLNT